MAEEWMGRLNELRVKQKENDLYDERRRALISKATKLGLYVFRHESNEDVKRKIRKEQHKRRR